MNAMYFTAAQRRLMEKEVLRMRDEMARRYAENLAAEKHDIATRTQYIWAACMIMTGLTSEHINKCLEVMPEVQERYARLKTDQMADWFFHDRLTADGCNLPMTESEF